MVGGKTRVSVAKCAKRFNQQARTSQKEHRHGDFRDNQQATQSAGAAMFHAAAAAFPQSFLNVTFGCEERWRQGKK